MAQAYATGKKDVWYSYIGNDGDDFEINCSEVTKMRFYLEID